MVETVTRGHYLNNAGMVTRGPRNTSHEGFSRSSHEVTREIAADILSDKGWTRITMSHIKPVRVRCTECFECYTVPLQDSWLDEKAVIDAWLITHACDSLYA